MSYNAYRWKDTKSARNNVTRNENLLQCPYCNEDIKGDDIVYMRHHYCDCALNSDDINEG